MPPDSMHLGAQIVWLCILSIPVACAAWTVTHEEIFKEPRDFCAERCKSRHTLFERKFFYLFTCEYCFSHYMAAFFLWFTHFKLLLDDWRGYVIAFFAVVWIANTYMNFFAMIRVDLRFVRADVAVKDKQAERLDKEISVMNAER